MAQFASGLSTAAILAATLAAAGSALLLFVGADPVKVAAAILDGAFGSVDNFSETLIRITPVAIIALALIPSLRIGLFNIGAPGQMGIGALFATVPSLFLIDLPRFAILPIAFVAAALGGGLTAFVCGILRARLFRSTRSFRRSSSTSWRRCFWNIC